MPSTRPGPLALHLTLRWRDDVLAVKRLTGRATALGDALGPIPGAPAVLARLARGAAFATVPEGATAAVTRADGAVSVVAGPAELALGPGDRAALQLGEFSLHALAEPPEAMPRGGARRAAGAWGSIALAALAHAIVFGLAAQDARASSAEDRDEDRTRDLRGLLATAEQRARAGEVPVEDGMGAGEGSAQNGKRGDGRVGGGARAAGEEGAMCDRLVRAGAHRRYAVSEQVPRDPAPATSRAEALADASTFGMIGLLGQGPQAPAAAFADPWAHGADAVSARGELWASAVGASSGEGGLGLTGIGEGGGGRGEGIGLGLLGTLGHADGPIGSGTGGEGSPVTLSGRSSWGDRAGVGIGLGGIGTIGRVGIGVGRGSHHASPPQCRCDSTSVSGRLPPEAIQRVVRQNFGRFRACYQQGLGRNPALEGTVRARFVIGRSGAVESAADGGSSLADAAVSACVVRAFSSLSFPEPEGGIVTVTYPIVLTRD
jgi:hypothetical protein